MSTDMSKWLRGEHASSQAAGPHRVEIVKVNATNSYNFILVTWDAGKHEFGPAVGPAGISVGMEAFAMRTVDGEWFLMKPDL